MDFPALAENVYLLSVQEHQHFPPLQVFQGHPKEKLETI